MASKRVCLAYSGDLLGTSLARPVFARAQVKVAKQYNCTILSHGYNLAHCSYEAGILEQSELTPPENMWTRSVDTMKAPDEPAKFTVHFEKGVPVKLEIGDKIVTGSLQIFKALNEIGRVHGELDQTWILRIWLTYSKASVVLISLSRGSSPHEELVGFWRGTATSFHPHSIEFSQRQVDSKVNMMAYKGNAYVLGRSSETSNLYSETESSIDTIEGFSSLMSDD
ncbi:hypothetical protein S40288_02333 [Stachybotrys chartarum IBT 40288]|nr:hypothetical protein S40288_02333 [Stachybotrys chartarum IBT 40288]